MAKRNTIGKNLTGIIAARFVGKRRKRELIGSRNISVKEIRFVAITGHGRRGMATCRIDSPGI